jgi:hypothetical protein
MPHGPAGTGKAAAEQKLLDAAMRECPHLFTKDRIWIMVRLYHGAARIARGGGTGRRPACGCQIRASTVASRTRSSST